MKRSFPRIESLELRRVLDATNEIMPFDGLAVSGVPDLVSTGDGYATDPILWAHPWIAQSTQLVRSGEFIAVVSGPSAAASQQLSIIRVTSGAQAEVITTIPLADQTDSELLVDGDRLLVIGQSYVPYRPTPHANPFDREPILPPLPFLNEETVVKAIDLATGTVVDEMRFPPGWIKASRFESGEAVLILQRSDLMYPMIFPPVDSFDVLIRFSWDDTGLSEPVQNEIPSGQVAMSDERIAVTVPKYDFDPASNEFTSSTVLQTFRITDNGVQATGEFAFDFRSQLIDIANDRVLLFNPVTSSLVLVDTAADTTPDLRETEIKVEVDALSPGIRIDDDRLLLVGVSRDGQPRDNVFSTRQVLVAVSLREASATVSPIEDRFGTLLRLHLIDAATSRFGFDSYGSSQRFVFGSLNSEGQFVYEGRFSSRREVTVFAEPDQFIVASNGWLAAYAYSDIATPIYEVRLANRVLPPPEAVDDLIDLFDLGESVDIPGMDKDSQIIDVLVNDRFSAETHGFIEITQLLGAPEDAGILFGRFITVPVSTLSTDSPLKFSYRISDGFNESQAEVTVAVKAITDQQRALMKDAVKTKAAEDFGVPRDSVVVELLEFRPHDRVFPLTPLPNGLVYEYFPAGRFTEDPIFHYQASAAGAQAVYQVNLEGEVQRLNVVEPSRVELKLVATNDAGEIIDSIEVGDSFWLEFRGDDNRVSAQGIFSSFLNLQVSDHIVLEDTAEPGPGFTFVEGTSVGERITADAILDLGVISNELTPRQGEPELLMRVRATARSQGIVEFLPQRPVSVGAETTLFGADQSVPEESIQRLGSRLRVVADSEPNDSTDVNGDGNTHAIDALLVINVMGRFGIGEVDEIASRMAAAVGAQSVSMTPLNAHRYDVNRSGTITPLDALLVINRISRNLRIESEAAVIPMLSDPGIKGSGIDDEKD